MGFISKVELKKQLQALGVKVEGNYVKKSDVEKILGAKTPEKPKKEEVKKFVDYLQRTGTPIGIGNVLNLVVYKGIFAVQYTEDYRGGWVSNHDDDEWLIYSVSKKQLKSLGVYKIHAAPPIDIETPREAERKEKERKDALNKKAVEMMKPFFDKLETDFKDFAKTYVYAGCPITVKVAKDRNNISLNSLQWKQSPIELVEVRFWWQENAVKEPQLLWSAETKLSGEKKEGGILYNYGEIEAYLSKVLNDSHISKPEK